MTVTKTPLIVVTDPDQHIIMKVLNVSLREVYSEMKTLL